MKKNTVTLQFTYNGIIILYKNNIKQYTLKGTVENYKVINNNFKKLFKNIIDELKINQNILTDNINVIIDTNYTKIEQDYLINILKEISFNKIVFLNYKDLIIQNKNEIIINLSDSFINIYYLNEVLSTTIYFNKHIEILEIYLKEIMNNYNIKIIKLFGKDNIINQILKYYEKSKKVQVYKYANPELIPIKLLQDIEK